MRTEPFVNSKPGMRVISFRACFALKSALTFGTMKAKMQTTSKRNKSGCGAVHPGEEIMKIRSMKLVVCIREIASEQSKLCQQNIGLGTIYLLVNHLLQPTRTGFYAHSDFLSGCEMVLAFQICVVPRKSAAAFPAFKLRTRVALPLIPRNLPLPNN